MISGAIGGWSTWWLLVVKVLESVQAKARLRGMTDERPAASNNPTDQQREAFTGMATEITKYTDWISIEGRGNWHCIGSACSSGNMRVE